MHVHMYIYTYMYSIFCTVYIYISFMGYQTVETVRGYQHSPVISLSNHQNTRCQFGGRQYDFGFS